jgi:hypothetical protein
MFTQDDLEIVVARGNRVKDTRFLFHFSDQYAWHGHEFLELAVIQPGPGKTVDRRDMA